MIYLASSLQPAITHKLVSKVHYDGFAIGKQKSCLIQKMQSGKYAVFAQSSRDYFYQIFNTVDDLSESFDEIHQLSIS